MTTLWPGFLLLSLLAMLFVLVPVWRYRTRAAQSALTQRRDKNLEVFRQRQLELEQDVEQGLTTADEHSRLLSELQRAFLLDMQALEGQDAGKGAWAGGKPLLIALVLLIPLSSLAIYHYRGAGPDLALPELLANLGAADSEETETQALSELAEFLQQRFERRPDDIQNGYMLGTLYLQLERFADAVATFEMLLAQMESTPDRAAVLGQLAQAQYMLDDSKVTPAVQAVIDEALLINPNESAIMSILAIDAFLREDIVAALGYWRRQLADLTPGSQQADTLRQRIAMVEAYLPAQAAEADQPEPAAAVDTSNSITVVIDIAPHLAEQVDAFQKLFIYVRSPAMPMPILAQNLEVPAFPFTLTLDNSMTMMGATLESVPQLVVGARLSRTGVANAQSGDLQTLSDPFVITELDAPIELLIDEAVP